MGDVTVIEPPRRAFSLDVAELARYRGLMFFLVWRDVKVRYKQTALGVTWAILQPLLTMVVFSIFFGKLAGVPSDGIPYPLFALAALVPWSYFSHALAASSNSLVTSANLLRKVYFPRLVVPIGSVLSGLVDFAFAFLVLGGVMAYYGFAPTVHVVWLPFLIVLAVVTALGVGLWLAALNVQYRDVRYVLPFLTQIWLFVTPIAYPSSLLPEPWRTLYAINPMAGVVEGFRWALLGADTAPGPMILVSAASALAILAGGLVYFRRMERSFADIV